jgi:hypothetical protein
MVILCSPNNKRLKAAVLDNGGHIRTREDFREINKKLLVEKWSLTLLDPNFADAKYD